MAPCNDPVSLWSPHTNCPLPKSTRCFGENGGLRTLVLVNGRRIEQLDARPGAQFNLMRSSRLSMIEGIQTGLLVSELGKQSGVINATLKGDSAQGVYQLLT